MGGNVTAGERRASWRLERGLSVSFEEELASRMTVTVNAIAATAAAPMRNIRRWSGDAVNIY